MTKWQSEVNWTSYYTCSNDKYSQESNKTAGWNKWAERAKTPKTINDHALLLDTWE